MQRLIENSPHITVFDEYRYPRKQPLDLLHPNAIYQLNGTKPRIEKNGIRSYKTVLNDIRKIPGALAAGILNGQAIATYAGINKTANLTGIVPAELEQVSTIKRYMVEGSINNLATNEQSVLIGLRMAAKLQLTQGDRLFISTAVAKPTLLKIVGIFSTGNAAFDENQIYTNLRLAQKLLNKPNIVNRLIVKLNNPDNAIAFAFTVERNAGYKAQSWQEASQDLMSLVKIRNLIMYTVVSAILIVASFGIYNVISTIVSEKNKDIAILKSIGFDSKTIEQIFILEGLILGLLGCVFGVIFGLSMMYSLSTIAIKSPFYSAPTFMPVYWGVDQLLLAVSFALLSAVFAAWLPARKGGKLQPVDILRGQ